MNPGSFSNNFDLTVQVVTHTGVIVKWKRELQRWVHVSINFFTSNRQDVILGFAQISKILIYLVLGNKNEITQDVPFPKTIPHQ